MPIWVAPLAVLAGAALGAWVALRLPRTRRGLERSIARARRRVKRLRNRLFVERARAALRRAGRDPRLPLMAPSGAGEDSYLFDLFDEKLDGFFIEAGAYDGVTMSGTYAFEALGWTGLLVEALPERYAQCVTRRPHSRVVHAALSRRGSSGTATFTVVGKTAAGRGRARDMRSFLNADAGGVDPTESLRKNRLRSVPGRQSPPGDPLAARLDPEPRSEVEHSCSTSEDDGGERCEVSVPLTTMDDLLAAHTGPIDFAVIDVEGGERDLLDGFDLARWKPSVLCVEDNTAGRERAVHDHVVGAGYVLAACLGVNRIWIRREEEKLLRRAAEMARHAVAV